MLTKSPRIAHAQASISEMAAYAVKTGEPKHTSAQQEKYESVFNACAYKG